jgi:hypothetical protein
MARSQRLRQPAPAPHPGMVRLIGPGMVRLMVRPATPLPVRRMGLDLVATIDRRRNGEVPQGR